MAMVGKMMVMGSDDLRAICSPLSPESTSSHLYMDHLVNFCVDHGRPGSGPGPK